MAEIFERRMKMESNDAERERSTWRERERERAREEILHAAADAFARSGFEKTSMKEIAKSAGISVGMLYNHFRGKEEIFRELIEHYITHLHEKSDGACNPDDQPLVQLMCRIRSGIEFYWENRSLALMYIKGNPLRLELVLKGWEDKSRSVIAGLLSRAIERGDIAGEDPMVVAALIVGAIHRLVYTFILQENEEAINAIPDIIDRIILKPLEARQRRATEEEGL
jgi:TetR/AcrR family transcriptional regulator